MHAKFVTLWLQVVQPLTNVRETKWTPHVKRESDVAQSYISSVVRLIWLHAVCDIYSRTPLIRPPSESHWCGRIRGMVAREGFVYKQKAQSVTRNMVV